VLARAVATGEPRDDLRLLGNALVDRRQRARLHLFHQARRLLHRRQRIRGKGWCADQAKQQNLRQKTSLHH
jgi:hypothetical protein